jgi:hypothetical protein
VAEFYFYCYPWDLEEEGVEAAMARLAGEIGADAVSVTAIHQDVAKLRPRGREGAKTTLRKAAAHFQPSVPLYAGTPIKPNVAAGLKSRNPLDKIARAAEKQRLSLRLGLSACADSAIVERHPTAACVNVLGETDPHRLCPSNPDVRAYLSASAEDLASNYPVTALDLSNADFGDGAGLGRFLDEGVQPSRLDRLLWSWCFCPSCRQRATAAGVDPEAVARSVRTHLEKMLAMEPGRDLTPSGSSFLGSTELEAYQNVRIETVCSLVRMVRSRVRCRLFLQPSMPSSVSAASLGRLRECCESFALLVRPGEASSRDEQSDFSERVRQGGAAASVHSLFPCCPPAMPDGDTLVRLVHEAADGGFAGIGFLDYGLAPEACLGWVRRAIRYARRQQT